VSVAGAVLREATDGANREGHRGLVREVYCRRGAKEGARATGKAHRDSQKNLWRLTL
jgi:hypothetical protein